MQTIARYLLERISDLETDAQREADRQRILALLDAWLQRKGASDPKAESGAFRSKSKGATGEFFRQTEEDQGRTWDLVRLEETDPEDGLFETQVSITKTEDGLYFYLTLARGRVDSALIRQRTDARCPAIVRQVLALSSDWFNGPTRLLGLQQITGRESGRWLAEQIRAEDRTVPIIVVSQLDGYPLLTDAEDALAHDTAGLANVYAIDDDASWGLTDGLGKKESCFWGAVRLYWPRVDPNVDHSNVWTDATLLDAGRDEAQIVHRLRSQIRRSVMLASALGVERPRPIDEVRVAGVRRQFAALQAQAKSVDDYKQLLELAEVENAELRETQTSLERQLAALKTKVQALDTELRRSAAGEDELAPDPDEPEVAPAVPGSGEIRYYKKRGSTHKRDHMVRLANPCEHNLWKNANAAPKAEKGIAHLEGSSDWKNLWKCGTCTGGGFWKVKW